MRLRLEEEIRFKKFLFKCLSPVKLVLFVGFASILMLTGCSSVDTREMTGTLTVENSATSAFGCSVYLNERGLVKDGAGKIVGTITIVSLKFYRRTASNFEGNPGIFQNIARIRRPSIACVYNLKSSPVDVNQAILIIEFDEWRGLKGEWILTKDEFTEGEISIEL